MNHEAEMTDFNAVRAQVVSLLEGMTQKREQGRFTFDNQRMMILSANAYGCLRNELIQTMGVDHARGLFKRFGFQAGFKDAHLLAINYPNLGTEALMHLGTLLHEFEGITRVATIEERTQVDLETGVLRIHSRWYNSVEAEESVHHNGQASMPQCWSLAGFATGHLSYVLQKPVIAMEHQCAAQGFEHCTFEVGFREEMERFYPGCSKDFRSVNLNQMFQTLKANLDASNRKIRLLRERLNETEPDQGFPHIIGNSPKMSRIVQMIRTVAGYDSNILITGESGTGKEVIARTIHKTSTRAHRAFVAINCATLSENLQNSELFGHVRGAFTGALKDRAGLFEQAHEGTLFLDEVGELAPAVQASFLRVLQEGIVMRVGEHAERKVNVRILAATHQNLEALVKQNRFREDLFYRLNVVNLALPPLRERGNDVLLLAQHFLDMFSNRFKKQVEGIDCEVARLFTRYSWPGNIRELHNAIERSVLFARGSQITLDDLPDCLIHGEKAAPVATTPESSSPLFDLEAEEKERVKAALRAVGGNRGLAAEKLGMSRSTLWRKLKKWQL